MAVLLSALLSSCGAGASAAADESLIHTVERGDLIINVREQGELQAHKHVSVASQVEGSARLIYLIDESSRVRPGDKLAELDVSELREKRAAQGIIVAKAHAAREQARKNVAIMEKEIRAAEKTAESRLLIAELRQRKLFGHDRSTAGGAAPGRPAGPAGRPSARGTNQEMVDKLRELIDNQIADDPTSESEYTVLLEAVKELLGPAEALPANLRLDMGEMANQILQVIDEISLARVDLKMANETLAHSRRLAAKDFITKNELERDQIAHRRALSKVTLSWNNLQLLVQYTLRETKIERQQEVENAELGLQSVVATSEARRVRERAELESAEAEYALAKKRLDSLDAQIGHATIRAPSPGVVVYAYQRRRRGRVRLGDDIDQRQTIVILPDTTTMVAEVAVHEAQIGKVAVGQAATVRIDALPGQAFTGRVSKVSSLPDSSWRNREMKLYEVMVHVDRDNSDGELRPGMTASVVIHAGVVEDVLNIPMLALHRSGNRSYVYKVTPGGPVAQELALGANNLTHVEVLDGLREGDRIHLVAPPGAEPPEPPGVEAAQVLDVETAPAQPGGGDAAEGSNGGAAGRDSDGAGK